MIFVPLHSDPSPTSQPRRLSVLNVLAETSARVNPPFSITHREIPPAAGACGKGRRGAGLYRATAAGCSTRYPASHAACGAGVYVSYLFSICVWVGVLFGFALNAQTG